MDTSITPPPESAPNPKKPEHTVGMLCHLLALTALVGVPLGNILGPLVLWLIKKDESPFIDECGKESLNFQITAVLAGLGLGVIAVLTAFFSILPIIGLISLLLFPVIALAALGLMVAVITFTVIASVKAGEGTLYRYPYSIRLIQ